MIDEINDSNLRSPASIENLAAAVFSFRFAVLGLGQMALWLKKLTAESSRFKKPTSRWITYPVDSCIVPSFPSAEPGSPILNRQASRHWRPRVKPEEVHLFGLF